MKITQVEDVHINMIVSLITKQSYELNTKVSPLIYICKISMYLAERITRYFKYKGYNIKWYSHLGYPDHIVFNITPQIINTMDCVV